MALLELAHPTQSRHPQCQGWRPKPAIVSNYMDIGALVFTAVSYLTRPAS
jgi:hypothetical protein